MDQSLRVQRRSIRVDEWCDAEVPARASRLAHALLATLVVAAWHVPARAETPADTAGFALGQRVLHAKFGEGVVLNLEGSGPNTRIQVNFEKAGSKWLVAAYANLQIS